MKYYVMIFMAAVILQSIVINAASLSVNITSPPEKDVDLPLNGTANITATIYCLGGNCGTVYWLLLTNDSGGPIPVTLVNMTTVLRNLTEPANFSCGTMNVNTSCTNSLLVKMTEASFAGVRRTIEVSAISSDSSVTWANSTLKRITGVSGRFLIVNSYTGAVYDRGENASVIVSAKKGSGELTNATINVTVLNPDGSTAFFAVAKQVETGRYNATFYLTDSLAYGTYRVFVNASDGSNLAYSDTAFELRPKLSAQQNETLYNISSISSLLNSTLLNNSNFGNYSVEKILYELNVTKNALLALLQRQEDFTNEQIFLITDSVVAVNTIEEGIRSGSIKSEDAQAKLQYINKKISVATGKVSALPDYSIVLRAGALAAVAGATIASIVHKKNKNAGKNSKRKSKPSAQSKAKSLDSPLTKFIKLLPKTAGAQKKDVINDRQLNSEPSGKKVNVAASLIGASKTLIKKHKTASMHYIERRARKQKILGLKDEINQNYRDFKAGKKNTVDYENARRDILDKIESLKEGSQCR